MLTRGASFIRRAEMRAGWPRVTPKPVNLNKEASCWLETFPLDQPVLAFNHGSSNWLPHRAWSSKPEGSPCESSVLVLLAGYLDTCLCHLLSSILFVCMCQQTLAKLGTRCHCDGIRGQVAFVAAQAFITRSRYSAIVMIGKRRIGPCLSSDM